MDYAPLSRSPEAFVRVSDLVGVGNWFAGLLRDSERRLMAEIAAVRETDEEATAAHVAEHVVMARESAARHKEFEDFMTTRQLAEQYRAGQLSFVRYWGALFLTHYRAVAWLLIGLAVLLGIGTGSIEVGVAR